LAYFSSFQKTAQSKQSPNLVTLAVREAHFFFQRRKAHCATKGCQIFLGTTYQNGGKYTKQQ
jgi:hypothetical protein